MNCFNSEDYNEYLTEQIRAYNLKKNTHQWAKEEDIKILADYIEKNIDSYLLEAGLCHGVRSGLELGFFQRYLNIIMVGSEIGALEIYSPSPGCVITNHDFNKSFDHDFKYAFIYSNSFDHAWSVDTFYVWANQIEENGLLLIEHTGRDEKSNQSDCLEMSVRDYIDLENENIQLFDIISLEATERQKYKLVFVYRRIS